MVRQRDLHLLRLAVICGLLGIACLLFLSCASSPYLRSQQITNGVLHAADLHSTYLVERSGRGHEANPFMPAETWQRILVKSATWAGTVWMTSALEGSKPLLSKVLITAINVGIGAVIANNYRIGSAR